MRPPACPNGKPQSCSAIKLCNGHSQAAKLPPLALIGREKERFLSGSQNPNNISSTVLFLLCSLSQPAVKHTQFPTKCCFSFYLSTVINQRQADWHSPLCLCVCSQPLIHLRPISGHSLYLAQGSPVITLLTTLMCCVREPLELPLSGWVSKVKGF